MSSVATITAEVSTETLAAVQALASGRGVSVEQVAGELMQQGAAEHADLLAAIAEGRRQIAVGEGISHEQLTADLKQWKRERKRAV